MLFIAFLWLVIVMQVRLNMNIILSKEYCRLQIHTSIIIFLKNKSSLHFVHEMFFFSRLRDRIKWLFWQILSNMLYRVCFSSALERIEISSALIQKNKFLKCAHSLLVGTWLFITNTLCLRQLLNTSLPILQISFLSVMWQSGGLASIFRLCCSKGKKNFFFKLQNFEHF